MLEPAREIPPTRGRPLEFGIGEVFGPEVAHSNGQSGPGNRCFPAMTTLLSSSSLVLLYDGTCGLCNGAVQLVLRHDRRGTLRFAPLQGEFGRAAFARHPEIQGVDSVV